ncbi:hypothetical protein [Bradyrhizobium manausense]|nr:hypothetical protein [Bradyrhizobium manausense]
MTTYLVSLICPHIVIASGAKQSKVFSAEAVWIASSLRSSQ